MMTKAWIHSNPVQLHFSSKIGNTTPNQDLWKVLSFHIFSIFEHFQINFKFLALDFLGKLYLKPGPGPGPGFESYYCVKLIVTIFWFCGKSYVFKRNLLFSEEIFCFGEKRIFCFQAKASVFKKKSSVFRWFLLVGLLIWENLRLTGLWSFNF